MEHMNVFPLLYYKFIIAKNITKYLMEYINVTHVMQIELKNILLL